MEGTSLGVVHHLLKFLDIINGVLDDVDFRHSLLAGSSRHMVLEMLVAVIDSLHSVSLPGVPPGHGHWDWRGYGVAKYWVVDHSTLQLFSCQLRFDLVVPVPGRLFLHVCS